MIQIRYNCFETNSSSTHSINICTNQQYKDWKNNSNIFYNDEKRLFFTIDELENLYPKLSEMSKEDKIDFLSYNRYYTYTKYLDYFEYLDFYSDIYTTPGGEKITVFGHYGYDG